MRPLGLRTRVSVAFGAGSLVLSAALAGTTFALTSGSALEVRERASVRAAYGDARVVRRALSVPEGDVVEALRTLDTGRTRLPLLRRDGVWYARTADDGLTDAVPPALLRLVEQGRPAVQRVRVQGRPVLVLGIPLDENTSYVEVDALAELDRTLRTLGTVLVLVAAATTLAGLTLGAWAARRLLRPVQAMALAATRISGGDLEARLAPVRDPDLAPLTTSFNGMLDHLAARSDRDRRFAADVSHELRSPLQTLTNASAVLHNRSADLGPRGRAAAELVQSEVARFSALVQDLLELAREDLPVQAEDTDVVGLVQEECGRRGLGDRCPGRGGGAGGVVRRGPAPAGRRRQPAGQRRAARRRGRRRAGRGRGGVAGAGGRRRRAGGARRGAVAGLRPVRTWAYGVLAAAAATARGSASPSSRRTCLPTAARWRWTTGPAAGPASAYGSRGEPRRRCRARGGPGRGGLWPVRRDRCRAPSRPRTSRPPPARP